MVLSKWERAKGFLFNPSKTFDNSKEDSLGDAFKYFIDILVIFAVLTVIIAAVAFSLLVGMLETLGVPTRPLEAAMAPLLAVGLFIVVLIGGIIGVFIAGLWTHIWANLVGGRKGVVQTIKAYMYGATQAVY